MSEAGGGNQPRFEVEGRKHGKRMEGGETIEVDKMHLHSLPRRYTSGQRWGGAVLTRLSG